MPFVKAIDNQRDAFLEYPTHEMAREIHPLDFQAKPAPHQHVNQTQAQRIRFPLRNAPGQIRISNILIVFRVPYEPGIPEQVDSQFVR